MGLATTSSHQVCVGPVAAASASERCAAIGSAGEWGRRGPTGVSRGADRRGRTDSSTLLAIRADLGAAKCRVSGASEDGSGSCRGRLCTWIGQLSIGWPSGRVKEDFYREKPLQGVIDLSPLTCKDAGAPAPRSARCRAMTSAWTKLRRPSARLRSTWAGTAAELDRQAPMRG